jgi:hypothetical protein
LRHAIAWDINGLIWRSENDYSKRAEFFRQGVIYRVTALCQVHSNDLSIVPGENALHRHRRVHPGSLQAAFGVARRAPGGLSIAKCYML